jgi:ribonuclease Z
MYDERGTIWMFDCGEATQHQVLHSPMRLTKLEKIFITHLHGDHIFGIPGLLASRSSQGADTPLDIYGPPGIKIYVDTVLKISQSYLQYEIRVFEIEVGTIFEDEQFLVRADLLQHGIPSFGYRIEEKNLPGTFFPELAKQAGVPEGPLFAQLKRGEIVTLANGSQVDGKQFVGPEQLGRSLMIAGDTRRSDVIVDLARDVDVLVHEATFIDEQAALANRYFHSTAAQAAQVALQASVGALILTHISARYQGLAEQRIVQEAQAIFPQTIVAYDHFSFSILRRK